MAMRFPENYVTTLWTRAPAKVIAVELAELHALGAASPHTVAQRKLLEIEKHLAEGLEHFTRRRFTDAIQEYKNAHGLIYGLINKAVHPGIATRPEVRLPLERRLFRPLVEAAGEIIEALHPPRAVTDFGPVFRGTTQTVVSGTIAYESLGVKPAEELPEAVTGAMYLAAAYADRQQWERAAALYEQASRALANLQTRPAIAARAAAALNLGAVHIQRGAPEEAAPLLEKALEGFAGLRDIVGQAQSHYNSAAALARMGRQTDAEARLTRGDQLLQQARGFAAAAPPNAGGGLRRADAAGVRTGDRLLTRELPFSTDPNRLGSIGQGKGTVLSYRLPGQGGGWAIQDVETKVATDERGFTKSLGLLAGDKVVEMQWRAGTAVPTDRIVDGLYKSRITVTTLNGVRWLTSLPSDLAAQLPHLFHYVIPVALGDCYHGLGEFEKAEQYYLQAAGYEFINLTLEVPALWQKLASNVLAWGDALYKQEEFPDALKIYRKVMEPVGSSPVVAAAAPLYSQAALATVGTAIKQMLENYETQGIGPINPQLAAIVLEIRARLIQLAAGLDFLGMPTDIVPIWSFEYLQSVARYFAQQAAHAEREFIGFLDRGENEAFTRQQLGQQVTLAQAEKELAKLQREAAEEERQAYTEAVTLAGVRAQNSQDNRNDYAAMSNERIALETSSAWYSAQNPWELENTIEGGDDDGRHVHEVIAENTKRRGKIVREYELAAMDRQTEELQQAQVVAEQQAAAAEARVAAAVQMEHVADLRASAATDNLEAFDSQFFTPEVWFQMAQFMRNIAASYLYKAIKTARLMQRAYNFENDLARKFVRVDYSTNTVKGMFAADALLLDIDTFTYDLITTVRRKEIPIKQTISLAERYPFLFETEFRTTGRLNFETRLEEFDLAYPGTYGQRIESIEVEVEGVLPRGGVRGVLTNGGISRYRTPQNQLKFRLQTRETLVLSEYRINADAIVFPADPRQLKIFEGAGTAGTWTFELPRASNDLDYRTITDVRLTLYYKARYDSGLAAAVNAQIASFAGATRMSRTIPARWAYPDAFFHFQDTGQLQFTLTPLDFPYNHLDPVIQGLAILVVPEPGLDPSGWQVRLGVPAHAATLAAQPSAQGEVVAAGGPWAPLVGASALGDYLFEMRTDENLGLELADVRNVVLILEYSFTPRT